MPCLLNINKRITDNLIMKFFITQLGCRLNSSETESLSSTLQDAGHELTSRDNAELHIINSCGVTTASERKTRQLLYQSMKQARLNAGIKIILAGCGAGKERRENDVYYISNDYKYLIPDIVSDWSLFEHITKRAPSRFAFKPAKRSSKTRINIKIQDGCSNFCSYCVIPLLRGAPESKAIPTVVDELNYLVAAGYKEFLLTGVCISAYSSGSYGLIHLLEKLLELPGNFRLHLSSISPLAINEQLADILQSPKMVKHLSLPLQSGSARILEKMNRHYTPIDYMEKVELVRKKIPKFNFTTDVIVGFPGETEADFKATCDIVKDAGFSHAHIFRYSPRPGTEAFKMDNDVAEQTKSKRSKILLNQSITQKKEYYKLFENTDSVFLNERTKNGVSRGFNEYYIPVETAAQLRRNEFFRVRTNFSDENNVLIGYVT